MRKLILTAALVIAAATAAPALAQQHYMHPNPGYGGYYGHPHHPGYGAPYHRTHHYCGPWRQGDWSWLHHGGGWRDWGHQRCYWW